MRVSPFPYMLALSASLAAIPAIATDYSSLTEPGVARGTGHDALTVPLAQQREQGEQLVRDLRAAADVDGVRNGKLGGAAHRRPLLGPRAERHAKAPQARATSPASATKIQADTMASTVCGSPPSPLRREPLPFRPWRPRRPPTASRPARTWPSSRRRP